MPSQRMNSRQTLQQELKQRPWRNSAYWLALYESLTCSLIYMQDHLFREGTTHADLSPPIQIIDQ